MGANHLLDRNVLIASEIKKAISNIFIKDELKIHTLDGIFLSFPTVEMSKDLSYAKIFVSTLNTQDAQDIVDFLNSIAKKIRFLIAKNVKLKKMPQIHFAKAN